ncbi:MAG: ROK family protein [Thermoanaerobaculia bacterium]
MKKSAIRRPVRSFGWSRVEPRGIESPVFRTLESGKSGHPEEAGSSRGGFPGVVRNGVIKTAPNLGTDRFAGFDLAHSLQKTLGKPCRVLNDADVQGYAVISGHGLEVVATLGTGFGTAIFHEGELCPHLEVAHLPFRPGKDYDGVLGNAARKKAGKKKWNKRVREAIENLRVLTNFDHLYLGGGNAKKLKGKLPENVTVVDNAAGILGGIRLWEDPRHR